MSLTAAFNTAKNSLNNTSTQLSTSARNIAGAGDTTYSRKNATLVTGVDGSTSVTVSRATDAALFAKMLAATSSSAEQSALLTGLTTLASTVGDTEDDASVAAKLTAFNTALDTYANAPDDNTLAQAAITAAEDLATALNTSTQTVQKVRQDADASIGTAVTTVNDLLKQFQTLNDTVVSGTVKGLDVTDALDQRDAVLAQLSEQMGITAVTRSNNDVAIYTDSGVTLFDKSPREVSFTTTAAYDGTVTGNAVFVDGVAVTGANAAMPLQSGAIAGLAELRDVVTVTYQDQLDEVARALIDAFSEGTTSGLFTNGSNTAVPTTLTKNLAATISINSAAVAAEGGSPLVLRDGISVDYNTDDAASYSGRLTALQTALNAQRSYSGTTSLTNNVSLASFASNSVSWLEGMRKNTNTLAESQATVLSQASTALSNATGVNTDQEYALQLELERSYQGASKLLGVVQSLYDSLFAVIK
ncbi:flagellar hook protein FlgK [Azorhizobium oxalatiphilum]|uniref:Flagellar hook-associated protein 1 n=1 Tax=Azorhizobium oxalatiphilum TaxID=980631 RepID=A0A917F582_9HYPH|nr:flagellar hook-associated protein FlgK [Azorhizobium oxalatiphilum]GGF47895.1 flagellar hook protein FlgK [Azorhizobium oxalatiphilum]